MNRVIKFGRLVSPDVRDLRFPMRAMLPASVPIVSKFYTTGPVLDQGNTPQCVGYSWRQFLTSEPLQTLDGPSASQLYTEAQLNDEWPGEDYDGSSVRGGAIALTTDGRLKNYVWGKSAADVRDFLISTGTVVMGTYWSRSMMTPDKNGVLKVGGRTDDGHAYLICGFDAPGNRFQMIQSWGEDWGPLKGKAWIKFADLDKLIRADGEACAAVEQSLIAIPTLADLAVQFQDLAARVKKLEKVA
jgi:hypothetical protein